MLSIMAVSYNCKDFTELLVKSVRRFTNWQHELIIVDNASSDGTAEWLAAQSDVRTAALPNNIGHGPGLDLALTLARGEHCLILDADSHLQRSGYEDDLLKLYNSWPNVRLVAVKGTDDPDAPNAKPIHPFFMFFETAEFKKMGLSFVADERHDVGRRIYYDLRERGLQTIRVETGPKFYQGVYGCNYYIGGREFLYHNWYSSRMWNRNLVDDYKRADFDNYKAILFSQPLVRDILEG